MEMLNRLLGKLPALFVPTSEPGTLVGEEIEVPLVDVKMLFHI